MMFATDGIKMTKAHCLTIIKIILFTVVLLGYEMFKKVIRSIQW